MGYKKDAIKGISWVAIFRIVTRILAYAKIAVLARILTPAQFGIFGIASIVLAFIEMLTETGINVFLVQSKRPMDSYINSAWVISIIRGTVISLILILICPFIVIFFNSPDAYNVILLMSIVPFLRGFINPAVVNFQKELQFNKEFWFRSSIFLFDTLVTIGIALATQSVYSLVWGLIFGVIVEIILSFIVIRPIPRLQFHWKDLKEIFHAGKWVTAYGVFNYAAQELDKVIVGKYLGATPLGLYQMAYRISTLPITEVTDVVSKVVFPVYAKIEGDKARLKKAFFKSTVITAFGTLLLGTVILLFPKEIVLILLGDKWLAAIPILQLLAVYGVSRAISGSASALFLGIGRQNYVTVTTFTRLLALLFLLYPAVKNFGINGAAIAVTVSALIEIPVVLYLLLKIFKK